MVRRFERGGNSRVANGKRSVERVLGSKGENRSKSQPISSRAVRRKVEKGSSNGELLYQSINRAKEHSGWSRGWLVVAFGSRRMVNSPVSDKVQLSSALDFNTYSWKKGRHVEICHILLSQRSV